MKLTYYKLIISLLIFSSPAAAMGMSISHEMDAHQKAKKKELPKKKIIFPESALAHRLLDGLRGIEIGGSFHNPFGLNTLNVDFEDNLDSSFKKDEKQLAGETLPVDIVAPGDCLPFVDNFWDFVISSHVIEHFYDPVKTIEEWLRVIKPSGFLFIIVPHKERTYDRDRPRTSLSELIERHEHPNPPIPDHHGHYSVWITEDFIELCHYYGWNIVAVQDGTCSGALS